VRYLISALGVIAALGFIAASAYSNYLFSATIATAENDLYLYRALAILAVTCNSLCPFFIKFNCRAHNHLALSSALILWLLAVLYSLTAAFGLAASTREWSANKIENTAQITVDIRAEIQDLRARKRTAKINARIDELTLNLETKGGTKTPDPQSTFISQLTGHNATTIRLTLAALYAVFVELGAALLLYISLAHFHKEHMNGTRTTTTGDKHAGTNTTDTGTSTEPTNPGSGRTDRLHLQRTPRPQLPASGRTPTPPGRRT
jgi:hypothetical protein